MPGEKRAESLDHVGGREQAAVPGDEFEEVRGQALDLHFLQDGGKGALLLLGGEHWASHEAAKILDGIERLIEAAQVGLDLFQHVLLECQLEQGGGIPARNA